MGINMVLNGEKHFQTPKMGEPDNIVKICETYRLSFWREDMRLLDFIAANFNATEGDMHSTFNLSAQDLDRIIEAYPNDPTFEQARAWLSKKERGVIWKCLVFEVSY